MGEPQSNIDTTGYRSLQQGEEVEFDLVVGEDGKRKAFHVTGPNGAPPQGSLNYRGGGGGYSSRGGREGYPPASGYTHAALAQGAYAGYPAAVHGGGRGRGMAAGGAGAYWGQEAAAAWGFYPVTAAGSYYPVVPRRGGFFPGGRNWVGARPPPPGQPGISSGLQRVHDWLLVTLDRSRRQRTGREVYVAAESAGWWDAGDEQAARKLSCGRGGHSLQLEVSLVVVHNLPWDCTWQQLKDAFADCGEIERADVVFDSRGRSRGFGIVRFPDKESAESAVEKMNNATIGGRVVSVRIDRFA
ncbi:hypothetical protein N2152v2_006280 [Parachlorella kessleri]